MFNFFYDLNEARKTRKALEDLLKTTVPKYEMTDRMKAFYNEFKIKEENRSFNALLNKHKKLFSDVLGTHFGIGYARRNVSDIISWSTIELVNGRDSGSRFIEYFHYAFGQYFTVNTDGVGHKYGMLCGQEMDFHVEVSDEFEKEYLAFVKHYTKWRNSKLKRFEDIKICTLSNKMGYIKAGTFTQIGSHGMNESEIFEQFLIKEKDFEHFNTKSFQEKKDRWSLILRLSEAMNKS